MPFERKQQPAANAAGDPGPFRGRRRMRHLDDQILDQLLEPEPDEDLVVSVADHAAGCVECRQRLEEWTTLFPQLRTVLPPVAETGAQIPRADLPRVVIPDNEPPRPPAASHRLAWSVAMVLLVAVVVLAWQLLRSGDDIPDRTVATTPTTPEPEATVSRETEQPAAPAEAAPKQEIADSTVVRQAGAPETDDTSVDTAQTRPTRIAAEMFTSPAIVVTGAADVPVDTAEEELAETNRATGLAAGMPQTAPPGGTPAETEVSEPEPAGITPEPEPAEAREIVDFPRRQPEVTADRQPENIAARQPESAARSGRRPGQPYEAVPDEPPGMSGRDVARMPATFAQATAADAADALGGRMRSVSGLSPERIYLAPGRIVPGARSNKVLVRLEYMTPGGTRMILDQQALGPEFASQEASIAVSTSETGVSVAQWVDRSGYSLSLAGRMSQSALLRYANSVR